MKMRNILLLATLASLMAGCIVNPRPVQYSDHDSRHYDDDYYDYRSTPSYEGYYYTRIIFIRNVPYYVDDNRYVRPIPPRMHDHFRRYPYNTLRRSPEFSRDNETRDGYRMSRIIYMDGVPYNVDNNRYAQPLPERLHQRFKYAPQNQGNGPANGNRPQPFGQQNNGRDKDQIRDQDRDERGQNGRNRDRMDQPPFGRWQNDERDQNRDARGQNGREQRDDSDHIRARDRDERGQNGRNREGMDQPPFGRWQNDERDQNRDARGQNGREQRDNSDHIRARDRDELEARNRNRERDDRGQDDQARQPMERPPFGRGRQEIEGRPSAEPEARGEHPRAGGGIFRSVPEQLKAHNSETARPGDTPQANDESRKKKDNVKKLRGGQNDELQEKRRGNNGD